MTNLYITTKNVGIHFRTVAQVRRVSDRRIIHTTDPRPYGLVRAAVSDGMEWAIKHGYDFVDDGPRGLGVNAQTADQTGGR